MPHGPRTRARQADRDAGGLRKHGGKLYTGGAGDRYVLLLRDGCEVKRWMVPRGAHAGWSPGFGGPGGAFGTGGGGGGAGDLRFAAGRSVSTREGAARGDVYEVAIGQGMTSEEAALAAALLGRNTGQSHLHTDAHTNTYFTSPPCGGHPLPSLGGATLRAANADFLTAPDVRKAREAAYQEAIAAGRCEEHAAAAAAVAAQAVVNGVRPDVALFTGEARAASRRDPIPSPRPCPRSRRRATPNPPPAPTPSSRGGGLDAPRRPRPRGRLPRRRPRRQDLFRRRAQGDRSVHVARARHQHHRRLRAGRVRGGRARRIRRV